MRCGNCDSYVPPFHKSCPSCGKSFHRWNKETYLKRDIFHVRKKYLKSFLIFLPILIIYSIFFVNLDGSKLEIYQRYVLIIILFILTFGTVISGVWIYGPKKD